jgi:DNA-binding MltR family transcriptional regulator
MALKGKKPLEETLVKSRDYQGFLDELQGEGDRNAAIIGAAFLDEQLRQLLVNYFVNDEKEVALLTSGDSPLGAFAARIRAAYCMGLISKEDFEDLKIIKDIRNAFAHQLHGRSFSDSDIAEAYARLGNHKRFQSIQAHTSREMFELTTVFISMQIGLKIQMILEKRCKTPSAPTVTQISV